MVMGAVTKEPNQGCKKAGLARVHLEPDSAFRHVHAKRETCLQDITTIQKRYGAKIAKGLGFVIGQQAQGFDQATVFLRQKKDKNQAERRVDRWVGLRVSAVQRKLAAIGKYDNVVREYTNVDEVKKLHATRTEATY